MKTHVFVFVRHHAGADGECHAEDVALAKAAAGKPPCTIVLLGGARTGRLAWLRKALGVSGIASGGVSVVGPDAVCSESPQTAAPDLPDLLAKYLTATGLLLLNGDHDEVEMRMGDSFPAELVAAVAEAAATYPRTYLRVGEALLRCGERWELRRGQLSVPRSAVGRGALVGDSPAMEAVRERGRRYAPLTYPVLILGETGTGKEHVAELLHEFSGRKGKLMRTNAAELPPDLAESLLFGHKKGSFTGATKDRMGRIREARDGTFFLDEAFNLHPSVQGKLLRALNHADKGLIDIQPLGDTQGSPVPSRLVVAAQSDPRLLASSEGLHSMREDLYFRLAVCIIEVPPLRMQIQDLPALSAHLLREAHAACEVSSSGLDVLRDHQWPGNVRELRLVLLRAVVDAPEGTEQLTADMLRTAIRAAALPDSLTALRLPCHLERELKRIEVATLRAALVAAHGNVTRAGLKVGLAQRNARNFRAKLTTAENRLRKLGEVVQEGDS